MNSLYLKFHFQSHDFALIQSLKIHKIRSKHEFRKNDGSAFFQRYAVNAPTIATFPARRSPLTGVSKWRPAIWIEKELEIRICRVEMENTREKYSIPSKPHRHIFKRGLLYSRHAFVKENKYSCFNFSSENIPRVTSSWRVGLQFVEYVHYRDILVHFE